MIWVIAYSFGACAMFVLAFRYFWVISDFAYDPHNLVDVVLTTIWSIVAAFVWPISVLATGAITLAKLAAEKLSR